MAATTVTASSALAASCLVQKSAASSSSSTARVAAVNGLPPLRRSRVVCSAGKKEDVKGLPALAASGASFAAFAAANPGAALALVDDRLSTEGTGLSLGVSSPGVGWVLFGTFTLIWVLYFIYASKLPEGDDDSGLSL